MSCSFYVQFIGDKNKALFRRKVLYLKYNCGLPPLYQKSNKYIPDLGQGQIYWFTTLEVGESSSYVVFVVEYRKVVLHVKVYTDFEIEFSAIKIQIYLLFCSPEKRTLLTGMNTLFVHWSFRNNACVYIYETSIAKLTSSPTGFSSVSIQYKKTFCDRTFPIISINVASVRMWMSSSLDIAFLPICSLKAYFSYIILFPVSCYLCM